MKPRNINNSLSLQPLVPDQENKNKKNEEKSLSLIHICYLNHPQPGKIKSVKHNHI
ncbi:hypothetical protein AZZ88_001405 [Escherichia coli]|nr:hypothetical protein AZZ88_001405 [Escherichia coli]